MLALRVLNGPQAGQIYILKEGKHRLGRAENVSFQVQSTGVSKEHLEVNVLPDKILITDLKSSNGTFVNGVRVQNAIVRMGDKLSLDKVLFDIIVAPGYSTGKSVAPVRQLHSQMHPSANSPMAYQGNYPAQAGQQPGYAGAPMGQAEPEAPQAPYVPHLTFQQKVTKYIDEVVLPGIYRLPEVFEFRTVVFGFGALFILVVTMLSILPMNQITSESIMTESRRRALTVARALAGANERVVRSNDVSSFSADLVLREEGIDDVYIVSKDGTIIAPPERAGSAAKEAGFIQQIRGQTREVSSEIGSGLIAASVPILVFDPELQQNTPKAHAVVIYNMGSLKFDDGRALSLFIQMLVIAMLVGSVIFFLLYKLIEYPMLKLNRELDSALREGRDHANVNLKFPILHQLLVSINSLLSRAQGGGSSTGGSSASKEHELISVVRMMGYPGLLTNRDNVIVFANDSFESLTGMSANQLLGQSLQFMQDPALQMGISQAMGQARSQPGQMYTGSLGFAGSTFKVNCQAMGSAQDPEFFVFAIMPSEQLEGAAS